MTAKINNKGQSMGRGGGHINWKVKVMDTHRQKRQERGTEACSCDSADLTGLGSSAAVPMAFGVHRWGKIYSSVKGYL